MNYPPNVSVSKPVNSLKGVSSRMLRKRSKTRFIDTLEPACGRLCIVPLAAAKHIMIYIENQEMSGYQNCTA
ncbi:MAG: transposase [Sutterella wadsworthensis]|nr:transposase [Sutterella wadsworthensis]